MDFTYIICFCTLSGIIKLKSYITAPYRVRFKPSKIKEIKNNCKKSKNKC